MHISRIRREPEAAGSDRDGNDDRKTWLTRGDIRLKLVPFETRLSRLADAVMAVRSPQHTILLPPPNRPTV